jgi:hypothetical protein
MVRLALAVVCLCWALADPPARADTAPVPGTPEWETALSELIRVGDVRASLSNSQAEAIAARMLRDFSRDIRKPLTAFEQRAVNQARQVRDAALERRGKFFLEHVIKRLDAQMSEPDRVILRNLTFRFTGSRVVNSFFDPATGIVRIPLGVLRAVDHSVETSMFMLADDRLVPFLVEHQKFTATALQRDGLAVDEALLYPIWSFAKRGTKPLDVAKYREVRDEASFNVIAFMAIHEFCHRRSGHAVLAAGTASLRQENDADRCAFQLLDEHGFVPGQVMLAMQWMGMASMNPDGSFQAMQTHANPLCRVIALLGLAKVGEAAPFLNPNESTLREQGLVNPNILSLGSRMSAHVPNLVAQCVKAYPTQ